MLAAMLGGTDADPVEIGFVLEVLQAIEHFAHVVGGAMARQQQEFLPQLAADRAAAAACP